MDVWSDTHKVVVIEDLDDDFRWISLDNVRLSVDLDLFEHERLVPGRAQRLLKFLGRVTLVQKRDSSKRIWNSEVKHECKTGLDVYVLCELLNLLSKNTSYMIKAAQIKHACNISSVELQQKQY